MLGWLRAGKRAPLAVGLAAWSLALALLVVTDDRSGASERPSSSTAVRMALSDPGVRRYLNSAGYTHERTIALDDRLMRISFFRGSRIVLDVAVAPDGSVPYRREYGPGNVQLGSESVQKPLGFLALGALFTVAAACVPLRRIRNLDVLALLSFTVTIVLLNQRLFELSVYAACLPLAYLGARCLRVALSRAPPAGAEPLPLFDAVTRSWDARRRLRVLGTVTASAAVLLVIVAVPGGAVGDVGFASMAGATKLLHGSLPYGNLPPELVHGDTYPLLAYASYVPAALVAPVDDAFDNLDGALFIAAAAALLTALLVFVLVSRLGERTERTQALRLSLAWLAFPPVVITASSGSNDLVAAAFVAAALALVLHAGRSATLLALAGWVKLIPFFLLPLEAARSSRPALVRALLAPALLVAGVLAWILVLGGLDGIRDMVRAVSFQTERGSLLSIWALLDVPALQTAFQAAVLALVVLAALWVWRDRTLARDPCRLAALAGAIIMGFQLGANYWSYSYLAWVMPCIIVALLAGPAGERARATWRSG
jgi:hypothetical protein